MKQIYTNVDEPNSKFFSYSAAIVQENDTVKIKVLEDPDPKFVEWIKPNKDICIEGIVFHFLPEDEFSVTKGDGYTIKIGRNKGSYHVSNMKVCLRILFAIDKMIKIYRDEKKTNEWWYSETVISGEKINLAIKTTWIDRLLRSSSPFKFGEYVIYDDRVWMVIGMSEIGLLHIVNYFTDISVDISDCTRVKLVEKQVSMKEKMNVIVRDEE